MRSRRSWPQWSGILVEWGAGGGGGSVGDTFDGSPDDTGTFGRSGGAESRREER
jgi:hypothetical protein